MIKTPETENRHPDEATRAPAAASLRPESPRLEPRHSIFDTSYAPEGSELRKAWSRFDRKKL